MLRKYIGDRAFYRRVMVIVVPIFIQNGITNFVSLLDNIMVGQIGQLPMSGVSIVNQLMFVFNICVFGASSGAGIFVAQFFGRGDHQGVQRSFRFKLLLCPLLTLAALAIFLPGGDSLIRLYLQGKGDPADALATLDYGREYLRIMLWGLLPFALSNAYSSTLRETGQTVVPMAAGISAVLVNLGLNYVLIFGHFGAPAMGVSGAALATVLSRYVELAIVAGWTHLHPERNPFIRGALRGMYIPRALLLDMVRKGLPLLANELLWSSGMAVMNQCYSTCGLDVVPAVNISTTIYNLASVIYLSMGNAVGILMGQMLGGGAPEDAVRDANRKLSAVSVASGLLFGGLMAGISGIFPRLYSATDAVRAIAAQLICVNAVMMPFNAYTNAAYFTLRSGGKTVVTFLFDGFYVWAVCIPLAFCLSRFTGLGILPLFALCQTPDLAKCAIGLRMVHRGKWIHTLAQENNSTK
ncbi:MAG: MATE family efflux transporter [Firmicutes bacterium]|nr:MATE family efflux transporter [Bacillota bacterium]